MRSPVVDLSLHELEDDPYPAYEQLRAATPVAWIPEADVWFVSTFDECAAVGRGDHGFVGATNHPTLQRVFGKPNVLTAGGEEHDDIRAGVDPQLKPGPVNQMVDDLVRPVAQRYLGLLGGRTSADLMSEYLEPVSVEALRSVMGLEDLVDADTLRRWFADLNRGVSNFGLDPDNFAVAERATKEIEDIVRPKLIELAHKPDESMLSHMLWTGREGGEPRPLEMILPSLKVILLGGMQEPGHAAGSTLLGLMSRPDQLALTYADPDAYIPLAVHEGLRWIAPIGAVERQASHDVSFAGADIRSGEIVMTILGSANRDEKRFDNPDIFDFDRGNRVHQAFGNGEHFCAGHFFARQVQRIMLEEMLPVMPGLSLDPGREPVVNGWVFRAPKSLPVVWSQPQKPLAMVDVRVPAVTVPKAREDIQVMRVDALRYAADGILSVELVDPDGGDLPNWEPGAHIDLWVVPSHAAHYSLCGDPGDRRKWMVSVLREPAGCGASRFIHDRMRVGDLVPVAGPKNTFPLPQASSIHFIAGGIGVTPILPMARAALDAGARVEVTYCGRSSSAMAFIDEILGLEAQVNVQISDVDGRVDLVELARSARLTNATLVACGPDRMLAELQRVADDAEVVLHAERFASGQAHQDSDSPFDVVLAQSNRRLRIAAGETILEVVEREGLKIPNACREGNCGSCETRVVAGAVDHRDVLLTPRQRNSNSQMMICVSRSRTPELILDL